MNRRDLTIAVSIGILILLLSAGLAAFRHYDAQADAVQTRAAAASTHPGKENRANAISTPRSST